MDSQDIIQYKANNQILKEKRVKLQAMKKGFFQNNKIKTVRREIQALEETQRDILNTQIANIFSNAQKIVDKNNYKTYESQVQGAYDMYFSTSDYGSELARGIVSTRVSLICGEGISIISDKKQTRDYIQKFLENNKLFGSRLISIIRLGELEGKNLLILKPKQKDDKKYISVSSFSWNQNKYKVNYNKNDFDEIYNITYNTKGTIASEQKIINMFAKTGSAVYVNLGSNDIIFQKDYTTNRLHCILTDIENYSRAKYDLRKNSHLFGKIIPYWKTQNIQEAKALKGSIDADEWEIGKSFVGSADFSLIAPPSNGVEVLIKDMLSALKNIATTTGIPIHWFGYPELMSNRATAENFLEVVNLSTKEERLIWEESFTEVIEKSMIMAIDNGFESNNIMGEFQVKLPVGSLALLKQISELWIPLWQDSLISKYTLQNMIPNVNPTVENKLIEKEKEEAIKNSPLGTDLTLGENLDQED